MRLITGLIISALLLMSVDTAYARGGRGAKNAGNRAGACVSTTTEPLSAEEASSLKYMYEEEKLAHDLYNALGNKWNARVFLNIAASEARHQKAIKRQLDLYGIDSSSFVTLPAGHFENAELQSLYASLLTQGELSLIEAYKVGAAIEEKDITDLNAAIAAASSSGLKCVYANLLNASKRHLAAFTNQLKSGGITCPKSQMRAMRERGQGNSLGKKSGSNRKNRGKGNATTVCRNS